MIWLLVAGASAATALLVGRPGRRGTASRLRRVARRASTGERPAAPGLRVGAPVTVPTLLELVAEVVASGAAPPRALAAVADCLENVHDPAAPQLRRLAGDLPGAAASPAAPGVGSTRSTGRAGSDPEPGAVVDGLAAALALSVATGAGPAALIRGAAEEHRRRAQAEHTRAAQRLGVLVLLPTGLCLLPAFVLLTVVPLVIDLFLG